MNKGKNCGDGEYIFLVMKQPPISVSLFSTNCLKNILSFSIMMLVMTPISLQTTYFHNEKHLFSHL